MQNVLFTHSLSNNLISVISPVVIGPHFIFALPRDQRAVTRFLKHKVGYQLVK